MTIELTETEFNTIQSCLADRVMGKVPDAKNTKQFQHTARLLLDNLNEQFYARKDEE